MNSTAAHLQRRVRHLRWLLCLYTLAECSGVPEMAVGFSADFIFNVLSSIAGRDRHKEGILTFLVGMVGSDGVLLASDRKHTRVSDVRAGFKAEKIFISKDRKLAYCSSGDEIANEIGRSLLKVIPGGSNDEFESRLTDHIRDLVSLKPLAMPLNSGCILLGRSVKPHAQVWHLAVYNQPACSPEISCIDDKTCEGDKANPASFLGEAYFPKHHLEVPVADLRLLAAHSVLMAGRLNSEYIAGLDMAESTSNGFRKLTPEELKDLSKLSADLHQRTQEWLLSYATHKP